MGLAHLVVAPQEAGERLDRYLAARLSGLSRSRAQHLIRTGAVLVNDRPALPSYPCRAQDRIQVTFLPEPEPAPAPAPQSLPLEIVYEDESLMVVIKPPGMVMHLAPGHSADTLANALLHHRPELACVGPDPARPGIVHRLDKDTSGLLVVAANPTAYRALQAAFARRAVDKRYMALVYGRPTPPQAAIEAPIGRDAANRLRMAVVFQGGRYARTEYRTLQSWRDASLLEVNLLTGRTHQIRVHLASIGHPVVGDRTYGRRRESIPAPRQMLHAARLAFRHPEHGVDLAFEAPLPHDLRQVLEWLHSRR